ncbi:hypothetical protein ENBRE01_2180 [Enteropsectra breve]|nr:hypothetical protein ENBRE01_2180 [Enteropsectra breve]
MHKLWRLASFAMLCSAITFFKNKNNDKTTVKSTIKVNETKTVTPKNSSKKAADVVSVTKKVSVDQVVKGKKSNIGVVKDNDAENELEVNVGTAIQDYGEFGCAGCYFDKDMSKELNNLLEGNEFDIDETIRANVEQEEIEEENPATAN